MLFLMHSWEQVQLCSRSKFWGSLRELRKNTKSPWCFLLTQTTSCSAGTCGKEKTSPERLIRGYLCIDCMALQSTLPEKSTEGMVEFKCPLKCQKPISAGCQYKQLWNTCQSAMGFFPQNLAALNLLKMLII